MYVMRGVFTPIINFFFNVLQANQKNEAWDAITYKIMFLSVFPPISRKYSLEWTIKVTYVTDHVMLGCFYL